MVEYIASVWQMTVLVEDLSLLQCDILLKRTQHGIT